METLAGENLVDARDPYPLNAKYGQELAKVSGSCRPDSRARPLPRAG